MAAVGTRFALRQVATLVAMHDGDAHLLPPLLLGAEPVRWALWWPHLGIAVDVDVLDEAEQDAKVEYANAHGILYCSPTVNATDDDRIDLTLLREAGASRRGEVAACT